MTTNPVLFSIQRHLTKGSVRVRAKSLPDWWLLVFDVVDSFSVEYTTDLLSEVTTEGAAPA